MSRAKGGKVLVVAGYLLLFLGAVVLFLTLLGHHTRYHAIEALVTRPSLSALLESFGYVVGFNLLNIPALLCGLVAWRMKNNPSGKSLAIAATVLLIFASARAFIPG